MAMKKFLMVIFSGLLVLSFVSCEVLVEESGGDEETIDLYDAGELWRNFSPANINTGNTLSISTCINNGGSNPSGSFAVHFYTSSNNIITTNDYYLGSKSITSIEGSNYANCNWSGTLPNIPDGNYYVGWIIDANNDVSESNEFNNTAYKEGYQLTVTTQTSYKPDLMVNSITPSTFTASPGDIISVTRSFSNVGTTSTGSFRYGIYLSTNTTITTSDTLIYSFTVSAGLSAGGTNSTTLSVTVPSNTSAGNYYIGLYVDDQNSVTESNENNNTGYEPNSITIGSGSSYTFTVINGTEGYLTGVYVGSTYVGDLGYGDYYQKVYSLKPSSIYIYAKTASNMGSFVYWDDYYYPGNDSSESIILYISSSNFSIWIRNQTGYTWDLFEFDVGWNTYEYHSIYHPSNGIWYWYGYFPLLPPNNVYMSSGYYYWYWIIYSGYYSQNSYGSYYVNLYTTSSFSHSDSETKINRENIANLKDEKHSMMQINDVKNEFEQRPAIKGLIKIKAD